MLFGRVERAFRFREEQRKAREEQPAPDLEGGDPHALRDERTIADETERGDFLAMLLAAWGLILPVCAVLLAAIAAVAMFLFRG